MKKFYLKLLMGLLLMAVISPPAQALELTVANNSATSSNIPVCCNYFDGNTMSQTIYSATLINDVIGKRITSIKYHASSALASSLAGAVLQISTGETTESTIPGDGSYYDYGVLLTGLTANGTYTIQGGEREIEFVLSEPIILSGNKNLAVEVKLQASISGYTSVNWLGENQEGKVSVYARGYSNPTNNKDAFMPKTTFTYELATTDPTITAGTLEPFNTVTYSPVTQDLQVTGWNLTDNIAVTVSGDYFSVSPETLPAAGGTVTVTFNPIVAGDRTGSITLTSGNASASVALEGHADERNVSGIVTPSSLNFETYAGVASTQNITIQNKGNVAFTPVFSNIASPFSIEAAAEIAVGETKSFAVTFNSSSLGTSSGLLTVTIGGNQTNISLSGTVNEAPKEVTVAEDGTSDNSYIPVCGNYFDTQGTYGQTIYNKSDLGLLAGKNITKVKYYSNTTFNANNIGGTVLEIYLMETSRNSVIPEGGYLSQALDFSSVTASGEYTVVGGEKDIEFNLTTPFTYSGNDNLAIQVRVKTASPQTGTRYQSISWIGKNVTGDNISYYYTNSGSGNKFLPKTTFSYGEAGGSVTVDPESLTFGGETFQVGQTENKTFTVANTTSQAVNITMTRDSEFTFTPSTVAAGATETITVTYAPTTAGTHTATLNVGDKAVALTGTAIPKPYSVKVAPESGYNYGNVIVNNSKAWTVTVTNNGTESVTPTIADIEDPFTTTYVPAALAAGESVNIEITFAPTEKTDYSNTITLSFPEAGEAISTYTYELTGRGVDESYDPSSENEVVKLVTVDKRSIYVPDFIDTANGNTTPQQLNCYDMRFRMAQLDDPDKQIKAGDLRPGNNLFEFYAIDDFGTQFRFATINLYAEGQAPAQGSTTAMDPPITVTPSVEYYTEEGMPVHQTFSHNTTLNYTEKTYTNVNDTVDLYGVIDYVNDTWSANTATNAHPDHYKFQVRGIGQYGELVTSIDAAYVKEHRKSTGAFDAPDGWDYGSFVGPNTESDGTETFYFYDLYIKRSFLESKGITGPVTVVINGTLSGSGFNADNYKVITVNDVEQIIAKEAYKNYTWTVPMLDSIPEDHTVAQEPMGIIIRTLTTGSDFNKITSISIYGGGTGVSDIDTVGIYKSSMNVKAYTQKQVDDDTDRNLVAMKNGDTETNAADVNVLAYADPAVTGYKLYENSSASTSGMTQVATATHNANGSYSVNSVSQYTATYDYERDESLGNIDGMWLPMYPADASKYFLPVTTANGVGDDGVVRSEGNTYGSAMQQVQENGSVTFSSSECYKGYTWTKDNVKYALYSPEVNLISTLPTGYELYNYRLWIDYEDDAPAWDFESINGKINLTDKMDRPLYDGTETHIGGEGHEGQKDDWAFVAPDDLEEVKLVARFYYKKSTASHAPGLKARPTDSDRLYYVVENQVKIPTENIVTGIDNVLNKSVANVKYYNLMGVESATPFQGVNIVVTTYDDGTRSSRKVIK